MSDVSQTIYVTGSDKHLFGTLGCLLASFSHRAPNTKLWVADFGLLPEQSAWLASRNILLPMPDAVRRQFPTDTPFDSFNLGLACYCKASILEYARSFTFDNLVWIDADILVAGNIHSEIARLIESMKEKNQIFAAAPNLPQKSIRQFVDDHIAGAGTGDLAPFAENINKFSTDAAAPYLNSGFFIARDRDALARWRYVTCTTPHHLLFEQNAFNLISYMEPQRLQTLDPIKWNLNNYMLEQTTTTLNGELPVIHYRDAQPLLVHATSHRPQDIVWQDYASNLPIKFFGHKPLRDVQKMYLDKLHGANK